MQKTYGAERDPSEKDLTDLTDREFFASFAKRTGMFIGYTDLGGVVAYIEGYDMASRRRGRRCLEGWREWLVQQYGVGANLVWWVQVEQVALPGRDLRTPLDPGQEEHVLAVLFELLDTFLAHRESTQSPG